MVFCLANVGFYCEPVDSLQTHISHVKREILCLRGIKS